MKKKLLRFISLILIVGFLCPEQVSAEESIGIEAPHAVLMEASTKEVLYEKDAHTASAPASVTKIMTMLLIFEALEQGKIKLEDPVTVSEKAASMGGSQVFLEPGEVQTVDALLKCIAIASANDACVSMAEHVAGSEEAFVGKMNEKARELGMENSHFVNCNGLDADGHVLSAYDVALMSRELLINYPKVHEYCTKWMDKIVHKTTKGSQEFGLNNTNKLIRQYEYCTGLKTGSTGNAGFCVSATAKKDGMELIAVIMNGETSKSRFQDARTLLNYGYANYQMYRDTDQKRKPLSGILIKGGVKTETVPVYEKEFVHLLLEGESPKKIEKRIQLPQEILAPVEQGQVLGTLDYYYGSKKLGEVNLVAQEGIPKAKYIDYVKKVWLAWMM